MWANSATATSDTVARLASGGLGVWWAKIWDQIEANIFIPLYRGYAYRDRLGRRWVRQENGQKTDRNSSKTIKTRAGVP
jgi:hypothetical protein